MYEHFKGATQYGTAKIQQGDALEIYGLYKQVTCFGEFKNTVKPAFWRFGECRKYWAWESCNKLSKYEALDGYVKTVRRVCPDWKYDPTASNKSTNPMVKTVSKMKSLDQVDQVSAFFAFARNSSINFTSYQGLKFSYLLNAN